MLHVQHQRRLWRSSGCGVRVQAVIVHMQGSEVGKQRDEVETTMFVAPMNVVRRDVVAASADPGLHTRDVQFRAGQPHVPDVHFDALFSGLNKKACDGVPAEGELEGKLEGLIDRPTQQTRTLAPCCAVGVCLYQSRGFSLRAQAASSRLKYSPP